MTPPPPNLPRTPPGPHRYRSSFSRLVYRACWLAGKWVHLNTLRIQILNRDVLRTTPGGYQIACTHLSHLEPFILGMIARRPIDWMTRIEFYSNPVFIWFLTRLGAIPVRRQGVSANAIRAAIERLNEGRVVGICPEGGVTTGAASVCRGGRAKRGVGLIAVRSGKPIIPCVILGTHALNDVAPWLPFHRGRLWVAFGDPIYPPARGDAQEPRTEGTPEVSGSPPNPLTSGAPSMRGSSPSRHGRAAREAITSQLERSYQHLFQQLIAEYKLDPVALVDFRHTAPERPPMSDLSYRLIRSLGYPIYWVTSHPTILHLDRAARPGGYILAANHHSPYDVPALMAAIPRPLDFLSIIEFRDKRFVGPFFRAMNCTFLDRRRSDPAAARQLLDRLRAGRVVAMFPEAGIRKPPASATAGGPFKPGVVHLAKSSGCPILPTVILNTAVYSRFTSWLPLRATPLGIIFGEPIHVTDNTTALAELRAAYIALTHELSAAMNPP